MMAPGRYIKAYLSGRSRDLEKTNPKLQPPAKLLFSHPLPQIQTVGLLANVPKTPPSNYKQSNFLNVVDCAFSLKMENWLTERQFHSLAVLQK